jgi:hypothetical protein
MKTRVISGATLLLLSPFALAQSSGNFAAAIGVEQCVMNKATGVLSGGRPEAKSLLSTTIQTPNSSQTTLLIRPSFVTGLYGNTYINSSESTANNSAEVVVYVTLDGKPVLPATAAEPGIVYDSRFQEIGTQMWTQIAECQMNDNCDFSMILSTLSAHSMDFVAPNVGQGSHKLDVTWTMRCTVNGEASDCGTFTPNSAAACVGPGVVTVTQTKAFSQSGGISVQ